MLNLRYFLLLVLAAALQLLSTIGVILWSRTLPAGDVIGFISVRGGTSDLYLMDMNRRVEARLTWHAAVYAPPAWSPDGQQIAFVAYRVDNWELFAINADGSNLRRLTRNDSQDTNPVWTADSHHIVFMSEGFGYRETRIIADDGSGLARYDDPERLLLRNPYWSEVHQRFLYSSNQRADHEIYLASEDSDHVEQLTDNDAGDFSPAWSPDEQQIVFVSTRDGSYELYLMSADGSIQRRLTVNGVSDNWPTWRPG